VRSAGPHERSALATLFILASLFPATLERQNRRAETM
jgi:hypothetical protein